MPKATKHKDRRSVLLSRVPEGAKRLQVLTDTGKTCYKRIDELADTDEIQLKKDGIPIVMMHDPGRKQDVVLAPVNPVVDALLQRRKAVIANDPILKSVMDDPDSPDVIRVIMVAFAEEQASIKAEKEEAERKGESSSKHSVRRLNALRAVGDAWLRRKDQTSSKDLDLKSAGFLAVFRFVLETFKEAMDASGVEPGMAQTIMARAGKMFGESDWESEAKNRAKRAN